MFIKEKVRDLEIFDKWTQVLISKLPRSGGTVDISDLFYRMTLDVTTDFLLGESVNSLNKLVMAPYDFLRHRANLVVSPKHEFAVAFTEVQRIQMMLTILS